LQAIYQTTDVRGLLSQLICETKTSWKKTATLGWLLVVGMFFWLPLLIKAVAGGSSEE